MLRILFLIFILVCHNPAFSDDKVESLSKIVEAISISEKKIDKLSESLLRETSQSIKTELEKKIEEETRQLKSLKTNFNLIASGVDARLISDNVELEPIDWAKEFEDLMSPLINEVKRLTSRPRELDRLSRRAASLTELIEKESEAILNIRSNLEKTSDENIKKSLQGLLDDWKDRNNETVTQLSIVKQKLKQLESEKTDFGKSIKELPNIFFRSRGRNLLLAFIATFIFWFGLRKAYEAFTHTNLISKKERAMLRRSLNITYLFFSGSGALLIFTFVLFLLGDWLLLIISLMIVLGIIWTSKHALPQFWAQGALLLNVGPVREGERVILNNVPWEVNKINLYSVLKNPFFNPSTIRVPLSDLISLRSREADDKEPWFISKEGDWILVNNEIHGKVINQTPSLITLILLGGARVSYDVESFLKLSPLNLSGGFRITKKFGFDYEIQSNITSSIPDKIKNALEEALEKRCQNSKFNITVELSEAAESSLDLAILADFGGEMASQYQSLQREITRICVDTCNKEGWVIPFNQLTVHMKK